MLPDRVASIVFIVVVAAMVAACASSETTKPGATVGSGTSTPVSHDRGESAVPSPTGPDAEPTPRTPGAALAIEASMADVAPLGQPFPVRLTVANTSGRPLRINRRLAMGYRASIARELFVSWEPADAPGTEPALVTKDYQRDDATEYGLLEPGASVTTELDLWKWYRPTEPGTYRIVVHYQADEASKARPADVVTGVFSSAPYTVRATR